MESQVQCVGGHAYSYRGATASSHDGCIGKTHVDMPKLSSDESFLSKFVGIVEDNMSESDFDVETIVRKMHMSHSSVLKKIKLLTGVSLVGFVRRYRLNKASAILRHERISISDVAYMTGFSDPKYFSKCFSRQFGKTPTEFLNESVVDVK